MTEQPTEEPAPEPATLTSEQRLRALVGDHQPKRRGGTRASADAGDPARRPGDVVDAVRERTHKDLGGKVTP